MFGDFNSMEFKLETSSKLGEEWSVSGDEL